MNGWVRKLNGLLSIDVHMMMCSYNSSPWWPVTANMASSVSWFSLFIIMKCQDISVSNRFLVHFPWFWGWQLCIKITYFIMIVPLCWLSENKKLSNVVIYVYMPIQLVCLPQIYAQTSSTLSTSGNYFKGKQWT